MSEAFVLHALRTAVVPHGGAFAGLRVKDLDAPVVCTLLTAIGIAPDQRRVNRFTTLAAELPV